MGENIQGALKKNPQTTGGCYDQDEGGDRPKGSYHVTSFQPLR